jgi:hypothetical protein
MTMKYVGGGDEAFEEVFKPNLFAFWKISRRHVEDGE